VLLHIAVVWKIPVACNRPTANFMISSTLMHDSYERVVPDYDEYRERLKRSSLGNPILMRPKLVQQGHDDLEGDQDDDDPLQTG